MNKVLIGIPTYFGNNLAVNCVASILQNVPDADIRILKNDIGWLKASNILMNYARNEGKDILLLNDDTFVLSNLVKEMQELAYSNEKIGIVGGKSLAPDRSTIINFGIYISPDGNTAHKYYGKRKEEVTQPEKQKAVEGSCIFIKNEVLNTVGNFDPAYGMGYREEVDFAFTARKQGWEVWSCPTAEYVHFTSQTNSKLGIKNETYDLFMQKWGIALKLGEV